MHFTPLFVVLSIFLWPTYGKSTNVLMESRKSQVFLQVFLKNALATGRFPIQQENIADIIKTFQNAITTAQEEATVSAFASVIADVFASNGSSIAGEKQKAVQLALEKTYLQIGKEVDRRLIEEVRNQIRYNTDVGVIGHVTNEEPGFGLDEDVLVKIAKEFGCIFKASPEFDLALLSKDPLSVIRSTIPAVRGSLGVKAAEALSKCSGGYGPGGYG